MRGDSICQQENKPPRHTTTAPTTWHRPSDFIEDTRSHSLQLSVRRWPRAERHQLLCTDSARSETAPYARTEWHGAADGLPSCRCHQVDVCCQHLVGVHHGHRPTTHWRILTAWCACRLPSSAWADGHPAGRRLWRPAFPLGPVRQWHILQPLLSDRRTNCHALCDRRYDFLLSCRLNSLTDSNFMIRQLFKHCYWLWFYTCMYSVFTFFLFFSKSGCCSMSEILILNKRICMYRISSNRRPGFY